MPGCPSLPVAAAVGLRAPHVREVLQTRPASSWFEVHSENYFADGGPALAALMQIRADYAVSLHGVGMSLGSTDPLDRDHLAKLKRLIARVEPAQVSEHLCWSSVGGRAFNDLLPLPYTSEALDHVCARVARVQDMLGHEIAVENVSAYVQFPGADMSEALFVASVARRTGCKLLLDVNNVYVNATNHGFDADAYIAAIPADAVVEYHLAGFDATGACLVDTHGAPVAAQVWDLFERTVTRIGPRPTLVEWDTDIPALAILQAEARLAQDILEAAHALAA